MMKTTTTQSTDLLELRENLDLLKDDIDEVQTLWEQLEAHYLSTAGMTGDKLRQFNAFVRMLTDSIDRASAWACVVSEELKD